MTRESIHLRLPLLAAVFSLGSAVTAAAGEQFALDPVRIEDSNPPSPATWDTLLGNTSIGRWYDDLKAQKDEAGIPLTIGAWHWFRYGAGDGDGYGIPGLRDTYYWYALLDPKLELDAGPVKEVGLHADLRWRENGTFRPFIDDEFWSWELYGYAKTDFGTFKVGQIWKRFGLDWDNVFYGNTPYFDGYKLDPDYGMSWEHSFAVRDGFRVDAIAQGFLREDEINGSIAGADAESTSMIREEYTGVARIVPTWTFSDGSSVALGLSGSVGALNGRHMSDDTFAAWAVDLTYTRGDFRVFGEVMQSYGTINPARYVSGGPSDRIENYLVGASYKTGPFTWRANYSHGFDHNPDGEQSLFLPGVTVAVTKNIDVYLEYVKWVVNPDGGPKVDFEDGMQFVANWRF